MSLFENDVDTIISMEDSSFIMEGLFTFDDIKNSLSNIFSGFKTKLTEMKQKIQISFKMVEEQEHLIEVHNKFLSSGFQKKINYVTYSGEPIHCPENFKGNLLTYGLLLNDLIEENSTYTIKELEELRILLSSIVSNPTDPIDTKLKTKYEGIEIYLEKLNKKLAPYFPTPTGKVNIRLRDGLKNVEEIYEYLNLNNSKNLRLHKDTIYKIEQLVDESVKRMGVLHTKIQKDDVNYKMKMELLYIATFNVAKLVERFSVLYYDLSLFVGAQEKNIIKFENDFK
jgi:hypothetical protein